MTHSKIASKALTATCLAVFGTMLAAAPAEAAFPNTKASCGAQLSQGGTPNGLSQTAPGFLGSFVSSTAKSGAGAVGGPAAAAAGVHGDLGTCLEALGYTG